MALAGALSVYAGFPEVAYIDALMGVCWVGWRGGCLERRHVRRFAGKIVLGGVAAALIAAPVLVASGGYLSRADIGAHANGALGAQHLGASAIPQLVMPYIYGQINADPHATTWRMVGGYLSTSLVLLALLGVFARGSRGLRLVLVSWVLLVFARMYGQPPLLGHVLGVLPDMSRIEFFRYGTSTLELSVIVLAALGLDDLARVREHRYRLLWSGIAMVAAVAVAGLGARPVVHALGSGFDHAVYLRASIAWGIALAAVVAAVALVRSPARRALLVTLLVACDALALFVLPEFAAPRLATTDRAPVSYLRRHLGESRFFTLGPIQPNYGSYFGLASLAVNDFPPKAFAHYAHARLDPIAVFGGFRGPGPSPQDELLHHLDGYRAVGVRYVLTPVGQTLPQSPKTFTRVFSSPTTLIYQLAGASPYFGAAGCVVASSSRTSAELSCRRPATLVRRETLLPGWSASMDGRATTIQSDDGLFQAVRVPPGPHHVVFTYAPPDIGYALLGMLAGIVLMFSPDLPRPAESRGRLAGAIRGRSYPGRSSSRPDLASEQNDDR